MHNFSHNYMDILGHSDEAGLSREIEWRVTPPSEQLSATATKANGANAPLRDLEPSQELPSEDLADGGSFVTPACAPDRPVATSSSQSLPALASLYNLVTSCEENPRHLPISLDRFNFISIPTSSPAFALVTPDLN